MGKLENGHVDRNNIAYSAVGNEQKKEDTEMEELESGSDRKLPGLGPMGVFSVLDAGPGNQTSDSKKDFQVKVIDKNIHNVTASVPIIGFRHLQVVLSFLMLFVAYGMRVSLSVAIVAMTDPTASINSEIPTYPEWTHQGAILSSFFWGYMWPQIVAGYIANRFGSKWFIISAVGIQSVLGFAFPYTAAHFGEIGVMVIRAIQGFCHGFLGPIKAHLLSQWVPREERARLFAFSHASVPSGTVAALIVTGIISASPYGWPMAFYLYAILGLVWCVMFGFLGYNSPAEHPTISKSEKYYIENSLGQVNSKPSHKVPWTKILTSAPVWALLVAQCGFVFGFSILLSQIPTYMRRVMNFNIKDNSLLSSLPYLTQLILMMILSFIADYITNKGFIGHTASRKLFTFISGIGSAIALSMLAFVKSDEPSKAVILLIIAVASGAAGNVGWGLNFMDLTSNHSGTVMGICNTVSHIFSIWAPIMVQILVKDLNDPEQWKIVFFVTAGAYLVTIAFYVIFASAEKQPWDKNQEKKSDPEKH